MRLTGEHHVLAMQEFIASRFRDLIGPSDIARSAGVHPAYAAVLFRRHRGQTLSSYLAGLRVLHAQTMLAEPFQRHRSIADIALASGFSSMSRFYEAFRTVTGGRPSDFRGAFPPPAVPAVRPSSLNHALWVDDQPLNNIRERRALANLSIYADTFRSNEEGAAALRHAPYSLVISDVHRAHQRESGWDFARYVRSHHPDTPFLFYCGFVDLHRRGVARRAGAAAICNQPEQLLGLVASSVRG